MNINSGIRSGLITAKHYSQMGEAVWLYNWCVTRQTIQRHGVGLVLRGREITYEYIIEDTEEEGYCFTERTLRRWMRRLVGMAYLEVRYTIYKRMVIRILKAKKFTDKQNDLWKSGGNRAGDKGQKRPFCKPKVADSSKETLRLRDKEKEHVKPCPVENSQGREPDAANRVRAEIRLAGAAKSLPIDILPSEAELMRRRDEQKKKLEKWELEHGAELVNS